MDVQLQELIDKIKKDGVASAEKNAQNIISEAEKKAAKIISEAEEKADGIIKNAKAETIRMEKSSEDAIAQAGRNIIISFRESVTKELSGIINAETAKVYDKDMLKKLIPETVKAWVTKIDAKDVSVLLSPKDLKALQTNLTTALKTQISKGLVLKADNSISAGFRIGVKDGSAFYDFNSEEVANLFSAYLNPKTAEIMKKASSIVETENKSTVSEKKETIKEVTAKKKTAVKAKGKK